MLKAKQSKALSELLERAYVHVKQAQKGKHSHLVDLWHVSRNWPAVKAMLLGDILKGEFAFAPYRSLLTQQGTRVTLTETQDAILLKALSLLLIKRMKQQGLMKIPAHVKGKGGIKGALRSINAQTKSDVYRFVFKTDVANYYASLDHQLVYEHVLQLWPKGKAPGWTRLIYRALKAVLLKDGHYLSFDNKGILRGTPLSFVLGTLMLSNLDKKLAQKQGLYYTRYMDDILILTKTRHSLKRVIKFVYRVLDTLKLEVSRPKTWIGRIEKGFDFLGYRITPRECLSLAKATLERSAERINRYLVQGASKQRIGKYVKHFMAWAKGGLGKLVKDIDVCNQYYDLLIDSPLGSSVNKNKQKNGERKCKKYYADLVLQFVPLFY